MSNKFSVGRTQTAGQTPFDNSTNGFTSDNVQGAIEEGNDPFAKALFDLCTPLFDHNESCNVELLIECGSD